MSHFFGWNTAVNKEESFNLFKQAVEDDPNIERIDTCHALNFLGFLYDYQQGTKEQNVQKAIECYNKCIEKFNNSSSLVLKKFFYFIFIFFFSLKFYFLI